MCKLFCTLFKFSIFSLPIMFKIVITTLFCWFSVACYYYDYELYKSNDRSLVKLGTNMCFNVNNIDENMYVEVHKYYLCIKFDIVFKI